MKKSVLHHCDTTRSKIETRSYKEFFTSPNFQVFFAKNR